MSASALTEASQPLDPVADESGLGVEEADLLVPQSLAGSRALHGRRKAVVGGGLLAVAVAAALCAAYFVEAPHHVVRRSQNVGAEVAAAVTSLVQNDTGGAKPLAGSAHAYNCMAPGVWTLEHALWCCKKEGRGCPPKAEPSAAHEAKKPAAVAEPQPAKDVVVKPPWDCAADGEDCGNSTCCSKPGSTCFRKNKYWAACNQTCTKAAGGHSEHAWSCEELGPKAPPACAWEGENCASSKCCRRTGFKCFQHDEKWASCSDDCSKLTKFKVGDGSPWTCKVLGGSQGKHAVMPASKGKSAGRKLFCFTVVTPQGVVAPGVVPGYEKPLQDAVRAKGLGIYACDAFAVYNGTRVKAGSWQSVVNTDIFIKIWNQVKADGQYADYDWTVKVDADAVFFPDRLKAHLSGLHPPAHKAVYLHNINFRFGFMGALEILSKLAVDSFLQNIVECSNHLGHNGGEDFFTMQCLDAIGVGHMTDNALLNDKYTQQHGWNLFDVDPCLEDTAVAFHPYKAINSWFGCHKIAMREKQTTDFIGCANKWYPDEACSLSSTKHH